MTESRRDHAGGDSAVTRGRTEVKHLVAPDAIRDLERLLDEHLRPHRYTGEGANTLPLARHYTTTIYFDTPGRALFRAASEHRNLKLRAREYYDLHPELVEVATDPAQLVRYQPILWLELKLRLGDRSRKRRVGIPKSEVPDFLRSREASAEMLEIQRGEHGTDAERVIDALLAFVARFDEPLGASCMVNYRRASWEDEHGQLRVTIDRDLAVFSPPEALWADERPLVRESLGTPRHREPRCIVEVKHRTAIPAWLAEALDRSGEQAASFSKFRIASTAVHGAV